MKTLEKHNNDSGVRSMKKEMLTSLKRRFADMEDKEELVLATILDPRYKHKFFNNSTNAIDLLKDKYTALASISRHAESSSIEKKPSSDLWTSVTEMLEEAGASDSIGESTEISRYLDQSLIHIQQGKPYDWWKDNKDKYKLAKNICLHHLLVFNRNVCFLRQGKYMMIRGVE